MSATGGCFHCGKPIPADFDSRMSVAGREARFCSTDCERVARLIDERGLTGFYLYRDGPTATASMRDTEAGRWAGYDREALQREFVSRQKDGSRRADLLIQGVRCAACSWLIESALGHIPGVRYVSVDPLTTRASLAWDPKQVALSELLAQLARLGYTPYPYTEDATDRAAVIESRAALKRLILAGLGMMQVMSFAIAMYAGAWRDPEIQAFLRLISLLVATPVVFYSGAPFFQGAWRRVRAGSLGMDVPVALAIGGAWAASVFNTLSGSGEVYFDSATMFVFFLSSARYLEMSGRHRALSLTGALARHLPRVATRIVNGRAEEVGVMELEPGDCVQVQPGQAIPADGCLSSRSARVDESLLTGESAAVEKNRGDTIVAGSLNLESAIEFEVERVGAETALAQIARLVGNAAERKPRLVEVADRIASWFVAAVLLIAVVVAVVWWQLSPERAFEITLAVLVVTCPCALALATPAAFTVATTTLARRGFMVRRAGALQSLAAVSDVVFDKTGTLTEHASGARILQTWQGYPADQALNIAAALEAQSEHPLARAFPVASGTRATQIRAVPGEGLEGEIGGETWRIGQWRFVVRPGGDAPDLEMEEEAGGSVVYLANSKGPVAAFLIAERLRSGTRAALSELRELGLTLHIASGDRVAPVRALADSLGVTEWTAALKPADKLALVNGLQAGGRRVAMLGDGINDSPVLAGADVSVAMGSGTSLAQHSADGVLMSGSLGPLADAVRVAHRTMRIVRQNLAWAVVYNLVAVPLAASGMLAPWMAALGMSASSLLVTMNALRLSRLPEGRAAADQEVPVTAPASTVSPASSTPGCCRKNTTGALLP